MSVCARTGADRQLGAPGQASMHARGDAARRKRGRTCVPGSATLGFWLSIMRSVLPSVWSSSYMTKVVLNSVRSAPEQPPV